MKFRHNVLILLAVATFAACDDNTASLGIYPEEDAIQSSSASFQFTSRSVQIDSIVANNTTCYFGQLMDPETDTEIKAEFLAQFHTFEDYHLPHESMLVKGTDGQVVADSCEIRYYFNSYYGNGINPLKMYVYELDSTNIAVEDSVYYTDINLTNYLPANATPIAKKIFTAEDYTISDEVRNSTSHTPNVKVKLPTAWGTKILRQMVNNPEYFSTSWQMMRHALPGFYFQLHSGSGTMLKFDVGVVNIFFTYTENDSIYEGVARFASTPEVIQCTRIENKGFDTLISDADDFTYLKSPAGIATELTFPIDSIYLNHSNDSVSLARVILSRINKTSSTLEHIDLPSNLLMVRKDHYADFFRNHEVADGEKSYTTTLDATYNTYTFKNISCLLAYSHNEKRRIMAERGLTSAQYNALYPDWNKVLVIPVNITTTYNSTTQETEQVSVTHDFSVTSTRIVGGTTPLSMQIIYSTYQ